MLNLLGLKRDAVLATPQDLSGVKKCFANPRTNKNLLL